MSKDIENIIREISKSNKDIHNMDYKLSKDIGEIKKAVKNIELKIKTLENKIDQALDILNTFTILIADDEDDDSVESEYESEESESWDSYESPEDFNSDYDEEDDDG